MTAQASRYTEPGSFFSRDVFDRLSTYGDIGHIKFEKIPKLDRIDKPSIRSVAPSLRLRFLGVKPSYAAEVASPEDRLEGYEYTSVN